MLARAGLYCAARRPLVIIRRQIPVKQRSFGPKRPRFHSTGTNIPPEPVTGPKSQHESSTQQEKEKEKEKEREKKERPPGTYAIWAMEAIGATAAFLYYLHLYTDLLKPEVKERLTPTKYTPFTLLEKEQLTADTTRFRFRMNRPRFDGDQEKLIDQIRSSGVWAVDVKDHMVQTFRTYTPVDYHVPEAVDEETGARHGYVDLVVKRYPHGSLSRFLHDTRVGDQVEMRGPLLSWPYEPGKYGSVYMIAGGTGVAPMYQLVETVLGDPADQKTRLRLLYGSQSEDSVIYRQKLDDLAKKHPDRLRIDYLVDRVPVSDHSLQVGRPDTRTIRRFAGDFDKSSDIVLVCGPDPMLASVSGVRPINAGQGPLAGALKELGVPATRVFKF
ncbi:hypothetical protein IW140_003098 [Coemansia sp. RSA 1813]|nr:hypothetical protein EV178_003007 [Coemansia sp. RSA 1646]KAJ1769220.1 hypothetical protein LPJ74_004219 [Coemansia sp. RSA 1843]KAJ2089517.1 hypothetical protein IW138_003406 [Coemansia sp. RSA 986]KAJ2214513.1 hypothetical protein EV179_002918 [Coemansia sp. RSA 487]KAJ2569395.1 hypothetical protein IW140_003098 [Coemansia sp. RSA 1813]